MTATKSKPRTLPVGCLVEHDGWIYKVASCFESTTDGAPCVYARCVFPWNTVAFITTPVSNVTRLTRKSINRIYSEHIKAIQARADEEIDALCDDLDRAMATLPPAKKGKK